MIINLTKPLTKAEKANMIPLKFEDYNYVLAFRLSVVSSDSNDLLARIPCEVGHLSAFSMESSD